MIVNTMERFCKHFKESLNRMAIIGMVHVRALPGTPISCLSVQQLVDKACEETQLYAKYKVDGICIENMFDIPYCKPEDSGPEVTAVMTRVANEVRKVCPKSIACGVQILAGQNREALSVALAANLQFIRVEGFVFGHMADEGMIDACAGPLLRYRKQLQAEHIAILTDIKKKHCAHSITSDVDIVDTAKAAQFFLSDGVIVTGKETGDCPNIDEIVQIRKSLPNVPIVVGSGVNDTNLSEFVKCQINGAIVGSYFKNDGKWFNEICQNRLERFMDRYNNLTKTKTTTQ